MNRSAPVVDWREIPHPVYLETDTDDDIQKKIWAYQDKVNEVRWGNNQGLPPLRPIWKKQKSILKLHRLIQQYEDAIIEFYKFDPNNKMNPFDTYDNLESEYEKAHRQLYDQLYKDYQELEMLKKASKPIED